MKNENVPRSGCPVCPYIEFRGQGLIQRGSSPNRRVVSLQVTSSSGVHSGMAIVMVLWPRCGRSRRGATVLAVAGAVGTSVVRQPPCATLCPSYSSLLSLGSPGHRTYSR
jgi:hypothetical protein